MSSNPFGTRMMPRLGFVPAFGFVALFSLIPAVATLALSFTDISGVPDLPIHWVALDNYLRFFSPSQARDTSAALLDTLIYASVVTVVQNGLALLVAVLLVQRGRLTAVTRSV